MTVPILKGGPVRGVGLTDGALVAGAVVLGKSWG